MSQPFYPHQTMAAGASPWAREQAERLAEEAVPVCATTFRIGGPAHQ
jgi:hypothetical protein